MQLEKFDLQSLIALHQKSTTPLEYLFFWGHKQVGEGIDKSCLSNWYVESFTCHGVTYKTMEHYMMAHKAMLFKDHKSYEKILSAKTAKDAKDLGRGVSNFDLAIWKAHRFPIVREGCLAKFSLNPELTAFLLSTGNKILVEASPYDKIWGIALSQDDPRAMDPAKWKGSNLLGFVQMNVRSILFNWSVEQIKKRAQEKYSS